MGAVCCRLGDFSALAPTCRENEFTLNLRWRLLGFAIRVGFHTIDAGF